MLKVMLMVENVCLTAASHNYHKWREVNTDVDYSRHSVLAPV